MAFSQHTVIGGVLAAVIVIAVLAGFAVTGSPSEARKQREDAARLDAVADTALALACYRQSEGAIPEDLSEVEAGLSKAASGASGHSRCSAIRYRLDPVSGEPFRLKRSDGEVTQICADFATVSMEDAEVSYVRDNSVVPDIRKPRTSPGEHCYELNLAADLD